MKEKESEWKKKRGSLDKHQNTEVKEIESKSNKKKRYSLDEHKNTDEKERERNKKK